MMWPLFFFFSSRRRHTRSLCDWSSDVCSSDLPAQVLAVRVLIGEQGGEDLGGIATFEVVRVAMAIEERSEERRVGKECRSRWSPDQQKQTRSGIHPNA